MVPPAWIGTRNGSAATREQAEERTAAGGARSRRRRAPATTSTAPTTAYSGWRWTTWSCGECQMSASSSTGASTSAPSIAVARARDVARQQRPGRQQRDRRRRRASAADRQCGEHGHRPGGYENRLPSWRDVPFEVHCGWRVCARSGCAVAACGTTNEAARRHARDRARRRASAARSMTRARRSTTTSRCIKQAGLPVGNVTISGDPGLQIGAPPGGPDGPVPRDPGRGPVRPDLGRARRAPR